MIDIGTMTLAQRTALIEARHVGLSAASPLLIPDATHSHIVGRLQSLGLINGRLLTEAGAKARTELLTAGPSIADAEILCERPAPTLGDIA